MSNTFNFDHFLEAQNPQYGSVLSELRQGRKEGHWMWFIFPQLRGLGFSLMAERFSISSRSEAQAYLAHPILGPRLIECTRLLNEFEGRSTLQIFGSVDTMKFRSCMTLFSEVAPANSIFSQALNKYFDGSPDRLTLSLL